MHDILRETLADIKIGYLIHNTKSIHSISSWQCIRDMRCIIWIFNLCAYSQVIVQVSRLKFFCSKLHQEIMRRREKERKKVKDFVSAQKYFNRTSKPGKITIIIVNPSNLLLGFFLCSHAVSTNSQCTTNTFLKAAHTVTSQWNYQRGANEDSKC